MRILGLLCSLTFTAGLAWLVLTLTSIPSMPGSLGSYLGQMEIRIAMIPVVVIFGFIIPQIAILPKNWSIFRRWRERN